MVGSQLTTYGKAGNIIGPLLNHKKHSGLRNEFDKNDSKRTYNLPSGNLYGVPWRTALALQAYGWILRQDIIWHKPAPMPESITNRCTKAHEYLFLFAKGKGYYYDHEAIKEPMDKPWNGSNIKAADVPKFLKGDEDPSKFITRFSSRTNHPDVWHTARNRRSVWTIASQAYAGAHFAAFPEKLVEPCLLAGTSEHGCCESCGTPYSRVVEKEQVLRERPNEYVKRTGEEGTGNSCANTVAGVSVKTVGWQSGCDCGAAVVPCTVLDPFVGSGTTCAVAIDHGRRSIGIDLSAKYLKENAIDRITGKLLTRRSTEHLTGIQPTAIRIGTRL